MTTKTETNVAGKISQTTRDYAKSFEELATFDKEKGVVALDDKAFDKALELGGISREEYQKSVELNANIAAGLGLMVGEKAIEAFKGNTELSTVTASLPTIGRDSFHVSVDRTGTSRHPKTGDTIQNYGILNVQHNVQGTRKGQYGMVRTLLKEQAKAALAG